MLYLLFDFTSKVNFVEKNDAKKHLKSVIIRSKAVKTPKREVNRAKFFASNNENIAANYSS